ncbi:MAG: HNH endonuclease, partial [Schwartzia sp.]|nr:HNH endonuclease [Schwartzia sp. (in: firmicutes)]
HIAWVSPDTIFTGSGNEFSDDVAQRKKRDVRWIAISKIEEFVSILNDAIDTTELEAVPFVERIPIGMYAFQYQNEEGVDFSCQVMVYNSTKEAYEKMMAELPALFRDNADDDEYLDEKELEKLEAECKKRFFNHEMIPPYDSRDVRHILHYYAQKESAPNFYTFDQVDRNKLDVSAIAKQIWDEEMGPKKKKEYLDRLWDSVDDNLLQIFFGKKLYFLRMVDIELMKISDPRIYAAESNVRHDIKSIEELPLHKIREVNPERWQMLHDGAFAKAKGKYGYVCAHCGKAFSDRTNLQIDHIIPMNQGGRSVPENLQILCRSCNGKKGDRIEGES